MNSRRRFYKLSIVVTVLFLLILASLWQRTNNRWQVSYTNRTFTQAKVTRESSQASSVDEPVTARNDTRSKLGRNTSNQGVGTLPDLLPQGKATLEEAVFDESSTLLAPRQQRSSNSNKAGQEQLEKEQARSDQPDEAARFRRLQMQDENGNIPLDGLQKAVEQMAVMRAAQEERARTAGKTINQMKVAGLTAADWFWLGPGNIGGRIRSIVIDPNNANKMWVGSVGGGIWRSTDAGATWSPVDDFLANLAISTIVMDPTNSNILYAGTGEGFAAALGAQEGQNISVDGLRGAGVFKSTDGGTTWTQLPNTNPANPAVCVGGGGVNCSWSYVNRLAISPNGSTILAATTGGIWRSSDGGSTWTQRTNTQALDIHFDPTNSSQAIAAELLNCAPAPCVQPARAQRSTDSGQNWTAATFNPAITGRTELAYAPSNPTIIYAAVNQNNGDIYQSTDGGQNYSRVNTGTNFFLGAGNQGGYDNIIWVNPQDSTFVVVGGIDLWRSTDSGSNFTQISRWQCGPGQSTACAGTSAHADQHMVVAHPGFDNSTNRTVYFSNDGGLFRTDDVSTVATTSGWINLNNKLGITQFYAGISSPGGVLLGGAQDNGTVKLAPDFSLDPPYDAQSWVTPNGAGGDGGFVAADPSDANFLYGEQQNLQLFRSSDGGGTVTSINSGITDSANANFIAPIALDPSNPNSMLVGSLQLWRSNDVKTAASPTWTSIKGPDLTAAPNQISAIAISATNSNFIVVGHNNGDVFLSTAAPPNFNLISAAPLPGRIVTRLVIDATRSPNWIYVTFGGFSADNVYVTRDLGTTWIDVTGIGATGLPNVPVRSLVINPADANSLYVGTELGIFASDDDGTTWQLPQGGPANVSVDDLFWSRGNLFAATHGRGIYMTRVPVYDQAECSGQCDLGCVIGDWNCPCTWQNHQIPTSNDDVVITCPVTLNSGNGFARSLRVDGRLTIIGQTLSVQRDVVNFGTITTQPGSQGSLQCRHLVNLRPHPGVTNDGIIQLSGGLDVHGDVLNDGIIAGGPMFVAVSHGSTTSTIHNLSGDGDWTSTALELGDAASVLTDVTVAAGVTDVPTGVTLRLNGRNLTVKGDFNSNGVIDLGVGSLNLKGTQSSFVDPNVFGRSFGLLGAGNVNLAPVGGASFAFSGGPGSFQPSLHAISGSTEAICNSCLLGGSFTIDQGATFNLNQGRIDVNGNLTVNGALGRNSDSSTVMNFNGPILTKNGSLLVDFLTFNNSGAPLTQSIVAPGSGLAGRSIQIGATGSPTTVSLANNMTFIEGQLLVSQGSTLDLQNHDLTFTGSSVFNNGRIIGSGTFQLQPSSGTVSVIGSGSTSPFASPIRIISGTATASSTLGVSGSFLVDPGATLSGGTISFTGSRFRNNGSVVSSSINFGNGLTPSLTQHLEGGGSFTGAGSTLIIHPESATTLGSDVTYAGSSLLLSGSLTTGPFTFSLPCSTDWQGEGEVIGNIQRTNLATCSGPIAFGNPFTTINFTSGIPPTALTVITAPGPPSGFPGAVQRTYLITPTGGSGYTATLRLHYLDSELNGNDESTLQLFRNDGTSWNTEGTTARNATDNWVEYAGVTKFSPWTISSLSAPSPTPTPSPSPSPSPTTTPPSAIVQFSNAATQVGEGSMDAVVTVTRTGDTSGSATIKYRTTDTDNFTVGCADTMHNLGGAFGRCDFAFSQDTLTFAPGESQKTLSVPIIDDSFAEGSESFAVVLSNATGATLGTPATLMVTITDNDTVNGSNPIFTTPFFVRQHYLDFLSREPEAGEPWSAVLNNCSDINNNPACDRLTVSAAFFGSPEFRLKGYYVYRFYKLAFNRLPTYSEIVVDMRSVTGQTPDEVFQKKAAFANAFVQRPEFTNIYAGMADATYVETLMGRYGLTEITTIDPAQPDGTNKVTLTKENLNTQLSGDTLTRAQVLRAIADSDQVSNLEFNAAFVAMQYFGYLRRAPDDAGYNAWLTYLNAHPNDSRTMVNGFMNSLEYRLRFGP